MYVYTYIHTYIYVGVFNLSLLLQFLDCTSGIRALYIQRIDPRADNSELRHKACPSYFDCSDLDTMFVLQYWVVIWIAPNFGVIVLEN